jgi:hypothetical protein
MKARQFIAWLCISGVGIDRIPLSDGDPKKFDGS